MVEYEIYVVGAFNQEWGSQAAAALGTASVSFTMSEDDDSKGMWTGIVTTQAGKSHHIEQILLSVDEDIELHIVEKTVSGAGNISANNRHSIFNAVPQPLSPHPAVPHVEPTAVQHIHTSQERIETTYQQARQRQNFSQWERFAQTLTVHDIPTIAHFVDEHDAELLQVQLNGGNKIFDYPQPHFQTHDQILMRTLWNLAQSAEATPYIGQLHTMWNQRAIRRHHILHEQGAQRENIGVGEWQQRRQQQMNAALSQRRLVIRVPPTAMISIIKHGRFKSQFETQSSKGTLDPNWRSEAEMWLHGIPPVLRHRRRMTYGYLDGNTSYDGATHYGPIKVFLKPSVAATATWMADDSLGKGRANWRVNNQIASPLLVPDLASLAPTSQSIDTANILYTGVYPEVQFHDSVRTTDIAAIMIMENSNVEETIQIQQWCREQEIPYLAGNNYSNNEENEKLVQPHVPILGDVWAHLKNQ